MKILKATIPSPELKGDSYAQSLTISCGINLGLYPSSLKAWRSSPLNVWNCPPSMNHVQTYMNPVLFKSLLSKNKPSCFNIHPF